MDTGPVIGILCIDMANKLRELYGTSYRSYLPASYVKFLEGAGAKVVPIWIGRKKEFYEDIMKKINGVLFPGGAVYFTERDGYRDAGNHIYNIARKMNESGDHMPILGICLGYELLLFISANTDEIRGSDPYDVDPRQDCDGRSQCLPLDFKNDLGRLFRDAPDDVLEIFRKEAVTYNFHKYCITEQDLVDYDISDDWKVLSTNKDKNGLEYISTTEHRSFPFYGLQFHPEKNAYEPLLNHKSCRTTNAIKAAQYLANFFVNECRKNDHKFESVKEQYRCLIYNYPITYTAMKNSKFLQCYMFEGNVDYLKDDGTDKNKFINLTIHELRSSKETIIRHTIFILFDFIYSFAI